MSIQVPPDSTGKVVETVSPDGVTERQVVSVGDPTTTARKLAILASGAALIEPGGVNVQPVSAAALPLPTGASTGAKQDTGNTSLGNLDANAGAITDAAVTSDVNGTISSKLRGLVKILADVWDSANHWLKITIQPAVSGGLAIYHAVAAASTNAASVKGAAGQVFGWSIYNNAGYPVYVKLHNTAGVPTAGAGVVKTIGVQAGTARQMMSDIGLAFATGIGVTIVKDITDAGATAVALSDCVVDIFYK